jgi:DNA sulfur modification protein DndD
MILKSIELSNFMCYSGSGSENTFEFKEGINLIIGDNGYGKSKLFDAFYWVMYDQVFDRNRNQFRDTRFMKRQIVSDKAIHEAQEGQVTASVVITLQQNERGHEYILERRYSVKKLSDQVREDEGSELIIRKKELGLGTGTIITEPEEQDRIKALVLPDNIKPYMWFQGEEVDKIIDFNKDASLTKAINVLSNIARYDRVIALADSLKDSVDKEYNKKLREQSRDRDTSESLEVQRRKLSEDIEQTTAQLIKLRDNQSTAEEKSEALLQRVASAEQIRDFESKRVQKEDQLTQVSEDLNEELTFYHKRLFTSKWVLKGTENLFEEYSAKYGAYTTRKLQLQAELLAKSEQEASIKRAMQTRLPADVPEPIHVQRMLDEERCLVCDRVAERGSDAWNKMKELIERTITKPGTLPVEPVSKHHFDADLKRLYNNGLSLQPTIKGIDADIADVRRKIKKYESRSKDLKGELEKLTSSIQALINDTALDVEAARNLTNEFAAQQNNIQRFTRESSSLEHIIAQRRKELDAILAKLKELVTGEIPAYLTEKVSVLTDFQTVAHRTRQRVFKQLVTMLEAEANKHYEAMTSGNKSARGIIRLKELANGNYMPELVDEQGNVLMNLNTGNIILIKLATIMAIISARQGIRTTDLYTLITDAPMSVFGEDYTMGFCRTVSKVYRQSIIMSKEFHKNLALREQLLKDPEVKLGKVYQIEPTIPETERSNRNSLATRITPLN